MHTIPKVCASSAEKKGNDECWESDTDPQLGGCFSPSHLPGMSSDLVGLLEHVYCAVGSIHAGWWRRRGAHLEDTRPVLREYPVKWRGRFLKGFNLGHSSVQTRDKGHVECDWGDTIGESPPSDHLSIELRSNLCQLKRSESDVQWRHRDNKYVENVVLKGSPSFSCGK